MEKRNFTNLNLSYTLSVLFGFFFATAGLAQTCTAPGGCIATPGFGEPPASHVCPGTGIPVEVFVETFDAGFGVFTEDAPPGPGTIGTNDLTVSTAGDTPSSATGAETTPGCNGTTNDGEFIFLEGSSTQAGETHCMTANIPVPAATMSIGAPFTMSFWHHMFGGWIGDFEVFVNGTSSYLVSGQQQTENCQPWDQGSIDVSAFAGTTIAVQVCISEATAGTGSTWTSDASIDHLQIFGCANCQLEVTCPADLDLGTFDCTNIADVPAMPATLAELQAAPYEIVLGTVPCGTLEFTVSDDMVADECTAADQVITRTVTIFDDLDGNGMLDAGEDSETCAFTYTISAAPAPTAVCIPFSVTLDGTGSYTLAAADLTAITAGSDGCGGIVSAMAATTVFDCSLVGPNTVTMTVTDNCGNTATCDAAISVLADATCTGGAIGNEGGPSIADPCTCRGDGEFDEEVLVTSNAPGQAWQVDFVTGLINPATGNPFMAGDLLTDNGDGTYSLVGIHLDGVGYIASVSSPFFPGVVLTTSNTCHYPELFDRSDFGLSVCLFSDTIDLIGDAGFQDDGVTPIVGTGAFTINGTPATQFIATDLGIGAHEVEFCFDAGTATGFTVTNGVPSNQPVDATNDPGCLACESKTIIVGETPTSFACNDMIQVSAAENCEAIITPDMLLEGGSPAACFDDYVVSTGNVPNPIPSRYFGTEVVATVTHLVTGNSCWGKVIVEDKQGPVFDCSIEITDKDGNVIMAGSTVNVDCSFDLSTLPVPEAIDNCDRSPFVFLSDETTTDLDCDVLTITKTYGSKDIYGNFGDNCTITVNVTQPSIEFPEDVTWTCQQYEAYNNVVDATALHPLIVANAASMDASLNCCLPGTDGDDVIGVDPYGAGAYWMDGEDLDVTLDPCYDDTIDNPITDGNGACGNATGEVDQDECIANFGYMVGCPYKVDCDTAAATAHAPQIFQVPIYRAPFAPQPYPNNHPIRGLEDADVLEVTGSGQPNVVGSNCHFAVTHEDELLEACPGADQSKVFKILRTWTVLNWCTGQVFTDVQVIKVLDKKPPVITFNDDDNNDGDIDPLDLNGQGDEIGGFGNDDGYADQLSSDKNNPSANYNDCRSSGLIDVPSILDDCSGITQIRVFTPAGEATPVEQNGQVVGYRIPEPYLPMGIHTITFEAVDYCGNRTTANKQIEVIDGIPPTNICREFTQVALGGEADGITSVAAEDFDEGSYDFCSPVYFKVRRMERFECDKANIDTHGEIGNTTNANDDQEWFDDKVKFCCEDKGDTVIVILRVYDVDPGSGEINTDQNATNGFFHRRGSRNGILFNDAYLTDNNHYNDCMIEVVVEDKVRPDCTPPAEVWANCTDLPDNIDYTDIDQLTDLFGTAIASDNCNATIEELNPNVQVDLCGAGRVIRRWRAEDDCGNLSLGNCQQLIVIQPILDYRLLVPGDFEEECDDASPQDFEYEELACDLFAINSEDVDLPASSNGECKKIIRTWTLINWCEYDGFSDPVSIPRRDLNLDGVPGDGEGGSNNPVTGVRHAAAHVYTYAGTVLILNDNPLVVIPSGGYYTYDQHIKIFDNTAPDVSYDGDTEFCGGDLDEDPCTGDVTIDPTIDDLCTGTEYRWELTAFSSTFSTADFAGDDALTGRYPLGVHTVRFYVSDECGNVTHFDVTFEVVDCKAPTPVCFNGLSIDVMPASGMVELWAIDFDASSFDYCHPLKFRINRVEDRNGDGFITSDDYVNAVPQFDSIQVTCANVGTLLNVQLWVGEESTDSQNNWDYCVTQLEVQDNNGVCGTLRPASIAGTAKNELGATVSNVDVTISGGMNNTLTTDNTGAFAFNGLTQGGDYSVTPMRNDDVRNGVSTYDLALISKHVLSVELLDSPYKMLAADANRSGNISTLDLVAIRKVILWVANDFPGNTSWRFVDKDQILNPANPFADVMNEVKNINNIVGDETANFVAVKVGDVSGDAEPQDLGSIDDRTFNGTFLFNAKDIAFETGDRVEVEFTSAEMNTILGYQFTMNFDNKLVDLIEIQEATANQQNFGQSMVEDGILTASWNGNATSDIAFKLVFNAKQAGTLSEVLSISSEFTKAEAYTTDGNLHNVGFNFGTSTATADFALYQNTPNPFKGETTIGFNLPEAAAATITVSDVSGKIIKVVNGDFNQGVNTVTLNSKELANGVLYYQLDTDNFTATKKMIIIE